MRAQKMRIMGGDDWLRMGSSSICFTVGVKSRVAEKGSAYVDDVLQLRIQEQMVKGKVKLFVAYIY